MEEKDSYTPQEFEDALLALHEYEEANQRYLRWDGSESSLGKEGCERLEKIYVDGIDKEFENCKGKIPKRLMDKLHIESISEFFASEENSKKSRR